ncbi:MAG: hypothetical protein ACOX6Y_08175 [Christensenellales bacterium]
MMGLTIDRFTQLLEEAASQLPEVIFRQLNLGIGVVEGYKLNPHTGSGVPAYTLGEYRASHSMGRGIVLYYGSFMRVYPDLADDQRSRDIIMNVLKHELTHHLESLAGARDLEIADAARLLDM